MIGILVPPFGKNFVIRLLKAVRSCSRPDLENIDKNVYTLNEIEQSKAIFDLLVSKANKHDSKMNDCIMKTHVRYIVCTISN